MTLGSVGVGYRLFNEIFYGLSIIMSKNKRIIAPINDYSCLSNKSSEFLYKPIEKVEALAIRKPFFNELMEESTANKMRLFMAKNYKQVIQEPMHHHRDEMASKFENKIDYIDISAYGIGKVNVETDKKQSKHGEGSESSMSDIDDAQTRTFNKIQGLDKRLKSIGLGIASLAENHDDVMKMMLKKRPVDNFQRHIIKKHLIERNDTMERNKFQQYLKAPTTVFNKFSTSRFNE